MRVSSGPELGAYHHEFFLRDKPHLAAQMFCKNARTMLAMASASKEDYKEPEKAAEMPLPFMEEFEKPAPYAMNHHPNMGHMQMLEQQMQLMQQQEQANRLLVERALLLQQHTPVSMQELQNHLTQQKMQQERMLQLRQLMQLSRPTAARQPSNNRASAA